MPTNAGGLICERARQYLADLQSDRPRTTAVDTLTKRCESVSETIAIVESLTRARLRWVITIAFGAGALIIPVPDVFVAWIRGLLHC